MEDNKCAIFIFITGVFLICICLAISVLWELEMRNISRIQLLCVASIAVAVFLFFWFIFFILCFEEKPSSNIHVSQRNDIFVVSANVKIINAGGFSKYPELKHVFFLNPDTEFADAAFTGCFNLETIQLPLNLQHVSKYTFAMCKELKIVVIPGAITDIGFGAFSGCKSLSLLQFFCNKKEITLDFNKYKKWGLKETCKIKFSDCEKTIKQILKEDKNEK